jgi:hypothetical protein
MILRIRVPLYQIMHLVTKCLSHRFTIIVPVRFHTWPVVAIYITIVLIMALWSKRWIVQREIAGVGTGSPAAPITTYWPVLDFPQTKGGRGIISTICCAAFGATWYGRCSRRQIDFSRLWNIDAQPSDKIDRIS